MRGTVLITLHGAGLPARDRERILEHLWRALRLAPGMVSADGNFELVLDPELGQPESAPTLEVGEKRFEKVSLERLNAMFPLRHLHDEGQAASRLRR